MRDHDQLIRDLLSRGLSIARGRSHLKVRDGDKTVVLANSPDGGRRSNQNAVAQLRRAGMLEPPVGGAPKRGRRPEVSVHPYDGPRLAPGRIPRRKEDK